MNHHNSLIFALYCCCYYHGAWSKLADRARWVYSQRERSTYTQNSKHLPLDGPKYRIKDRLLLDDASQAKSSSERRNLGSSTKSDGCCTQYQSYSAETLCSAYGENCYTASSQSHDSGDGSCSMVGLSFIGLSFSVNTPSGNPYSYQLCDQFPMENLIDRDYDYVMSMDEDGWLVGGGYKSFDYSGKMPYIDSSHTEILRIGSLDPTYGGTTIEQVYNAMSTISFPPFSVYPEYVKFGGGRRGNSNSYNVPSGDITLIVSVVETYENGETYSTYEIFLNALFTAMYSVNGGPCMDDHDTDPHISMARGVKFKSSDHQTSYFYKANLEVAVWQSMYPNGVVLGSKSMASFPPNNAHRSRSVVGYGNMYFFFDRNNITKAWSPSRKLTSTEAYYAKLYDPYDTSKTASFYSSTTTVSYNYNKQSGDKNNGQSYSYEHNPYNWNPLLARHDMTSGWDLPPNCFMEGETFFGIPLSRASDSKLQTSSTFQNQFDFEYLTDRNYTYMMKFGTNHGWLVGEVLNNGPASIVDKDTLHIPLFYVGTTNPKMGGMSLKNMIKIAQDINFDPLYIKPAFVFQDYNDGHLKLQFEADANSALGNLYDSLCKAMGIEWNGVSPYNKYGVYTKCAMHSAGDRAAYGCGPENANYGGFCPQMIIAYKPKFKSKDAGAAFIARCNKYIDYWRSLYPLGVAVGTTKFCTEGGCMGLFLNRYDLYQVFKPAKGGSWVGLNPTSSVPLECNDASAPCTPIHRMNHWASNNLFNKLGPVGKFSFFLLSFMSLTLAISIFLARARRRRKMGESYFAFWLRDLQSDTRKKIKPRRRRIISDPGLEEDMLSSASEEQKRPRRRSRGRSRRSRSRNPNPHRDDRYVIPSDRTDSNQVETNQIV